MPCKKTLVLLIHTIRPLSQAPFPHALLNKHFSTRVDKFLFFLGSLFDMPKPCLVGVLSRRTGAFQTSAELARRPQKKIMFCESQLVPTLYKHHQSNPFSSKVLSLSSIKDYAQTRSGDVGYALRWREDYGSAKRGFCGTSG